MSHTTDVGEARRYAASLATLQEWDEAATGRLSIAIVEAGTNMIKHAGKGEFLISALQGPRMGVEFLAIDKGPGMSDLDECLRDGYSTAGTPGGGLGAIRRLADESDIFSRAGKGTVVMGRFYSKSAREEHGFAVGAVRTPVRGETVCGDSWSVRTQGALQMFLVADGLGHGAGAAEASQEAVAVFENSQEASPTAMLETIHTRLRSTRGAAVAITVVNTSSGATQFAGVGNISAMITDGRSVQHLVSQNGTAGHSVRKIVEYKHHWPGRGMLIMHSDGINTSWRLDSYSGIVFRHPALTAALLYRDASRGRDDVCVLAAANREVQLA